LASRRLSKAPKADSPEGLAILRAVKESKKEKVIAARKGKSDSELIKQLILDGILSE
jgi:hypothetical protein